MRSDYPVSRTLMLAVNSSAFPISPSAIVKSPELTRRTWMNVLRQASTVTAGSVADSQMNAVAVTAVVFLCGPVTPLLFNAMFN